MSSVFWVDVDRSGEAIPLGNFDPFACLVSDPEPEPEEGEKAAWSAVVRRSMIVWRSLFSRATEERACRIAY